MPELPDVEGFRERLSATLPGRRIDSVEVRDSGVLRNASARALNRVLSGRRFEEPRRHGKWLLLPADGPTLLVHSGMTGRPYYTSAGDGDRHDRVVITLDRGELHYADQRKLRGIWLVGDHEDDHEALMTSTTCSVTRGPTRSVSIGTCSLRSCGATAARSSRPSWTSR
ncbi:DNA-formamidopyrimidine glycosylase family protein [Mycobacterium sp. G7A2]|uniref:DNA-formamidopyrimidine glycosylase family protein n=1 Tax=Mycobacterium sp. G7A2 TaxID=3317307 RepID=UPI0035A8F598